MVCYLPEMHFKNTSMFKVNEQKKDVQAYVRHKRVEIARTMPSCSSR